jgi:hypothetical protein
MKTITAILIGIFLILSLSCKDKSTNPPVTENIIFSAYSTACLNPENSIFLKISTSDSLLYSFNDSLVIDYMVTTSCSDVSPFKLGYDLRPDTIILDISDTVISAANCLCSYRTHFDFLQLAGGSYYVSRIYSWREPDTTRPYNPNKFITYSDTAYLGKVIRSR